MNIIHIVRGDFSPNSLNGVYRVIDCLSVALRNHIGGGKITVCSVYRGSHEPIYQSEYYNHVQFDEHPLRFFLDGKFKNFLLSQSKDTVFHFHSVFIPWFLPAVKLLKSHGFERVVLTPHGQYVDEAMQRSLKKRVFFRFFDRNVLRTVDAVQMIGHTEENEYINANAKESYLIPNGCDVLDIAPKDKKELVFGYLGRLEIAQKGVDTMVQAFGFYRKQGGKGILRIAGDGADKAQLHALCTDMGIEKEVEFVGKVFGEDKWKYLQSFTWFLHPSHWEGIPTACLEAASCGVPLIVSTATNMDSYLEQFHSGLVMRSDGRPVQALADLLFEAENIFSDEKEYQKYVDNSLKMIATKLNWNYIAEEVLSKLYKGIK